MALGYDLHSIGPQTFCGVKIMQSWADLLLIERLLEYHRFEQIVEFGTAAGGLALFLQGQAVQRGIQFLTFDVDRPMIHLDGFRRMDVFADAAEIREMLVSPLLLFCDGGDKPREVAEYAPTLTEGDFVAVHDWEAEFWQADIPHYMDAMYEPLCNEIESHWRVLRRTARAV